MSQEAEKYLMLIAEKWPSSVVAREKISDFSGGILSSGYLANLACIGEGPESFKIGRKVVYPVTPLIKWMVSRVGVNQN